MRGFSFDLKLKANYVIYMVTLRNIKLLIMNIFCFSIRLLKANKFLNWREHISLN